MSDVSHEIPRKANRTPRQTRNQRNLNHEHSVFEAPKSWNCYLLVLSTLNRTRRRPWLSALVRPRFCTGQLRPLCPRESQLPFLLRIPRYFHSKRNGFLAFASDRALIRISSLFAFDSARSRLSFSVSSRIWCVENTHENHVLLVFSANT